MRLYRKVVPRIAREILKVLSTQKLIEVEQDRIDEAELDLAAVMVEYLNIEEEIAHEARETLQRRGMTQDRFSQLKKGLAEIRGIKVGDEALDYVLSQMTEALFSSKNIVEIYGEDRALRTAIKDIIDKFLSIPEDIDKEARDKIKNLREGTPEWDIEYPRQVSAIKRKRGLA